MKITIAQSAKSINYPRFRSLNDLCFPNEPVSENLYQEFLRANFWAMLDQDVLIGYAVMKYTANNAHINRICIHPDCRSQGLGHQLMTTLLKAATSAGVHQVNLLVQQDNPTAIRLYRKHNFQITGESIQFLVPIVASGESRSALITIDEYRHEQDYHPHDQRIMVWEKHHNPPQNHLLVFIKDQKALGFCRFSPEFPGCLPFEIFAEGEVVDLQDLISLFSAYTLPEKRPLKITTENAHAIRLFMELGSQENYSLFEMTTRLMR